MKNFIFKLSLFALPLLLLVLLPVYILFSSGENFRGIDKVVESRSKYLIGYAYNEENYGYLKWKALKSMDRNSIVALGSSRVLQFRGKMFDSSFYNAGYTISGIGDFIPFLESIPKEKYPDYLLIGLDQWMFNSAWDNLSLKVDKEKWAESFQSLPDIKTLKNIWNDLLAKKYGLLLQSHHDNIKHIGLNAIVNNKGFRNDGSMYYGDQIEKLLNNDKTAEDYNYAGTFDRIDKGNRRFEYGQEVNDNAVIELERLLQFCKLNRMKVIGILPPFADKVNEKLTASGRYKHLDSIYPATVKIFQQHGFELYDFTHLGSFNSNDTETIDGFHAGELAYLKMLVKMLESNSQLKNVCNLKRLQQDVTHPVNRYKVYSE